MQIALRQPQFADNFNHEQNASLLRHKRSSIPHLVGVQQSDYRAKLRFAWLQSDPRGYEEAILTIAYSHLRRRHAPPASVAASATWNLVSSASSSWITETPDTEIWTVDTVASTSWST